MKLTLTVVFSAALSLASAAAMAGGDVAKGKEKSAVCAACHGVDGNSEIPANPRLAGQHASYLLRALQDYKSGARNNPVMAGFATALSKQDMEDLAAYFASQPGLNTPD